MDFYSVVVGAPDSNLFVRPTAKCEKSVPGDKGSILEKISKPGKRAVQIVDEAVVDNPSVPVIADSFSTNFKGETVRLSDFETERDSDTVLPQHFRTARFPRKDHL